MNNIKIVLGEKGLTQTRLSAELGKSYNMVNSYVQNRRQPSIGILFDIAKILKVDTKDLLANKVIKKK
jgi:repressor LexA